MRQMKLKTMLSANYANCDQTDQSDQTDLQDRIRDGWCENRQTCKIANLQTSVQEMHLKMAVKFWLKYKDLLNQAVFGKICIKTYNMYKY